MSEDEIHPPDDSPWADEQTDVPDPPAYNPDYELVGYLEEKEGSAPANKRG